MFDKHSRRRSDASFRDKHNGHGGWHAVRRGHRTGPNLLHSGAFKRKPVRLYRRDVSAIDERGRTMLRYMAAQGVYLTANGIYSSYIVDEIQSAGLSKRRCSR